MFSVPVGGNGDDSVSNMELSFADTTTSLYPCHLPCRHVDLALHCGVMPIHASTDGAVWADLGPEKSSCMNLTLSMPAPPSASEKGYTISGYRGDLRPSAALPGQEERKCRSTL
eukprot:TRINITY_DN111936_c0_g1_i1.p1 TRINITY_DN111936_c0_g1~~TRINITY_DN111936_c0_g1_i1.p1  ORF type:complete len:114 (+),score=14.85 TRINITY_DN111936_c0_g1_i1:138-479(+)